jgi:hypothetical protein
MLKADLLVGSLICAVAVVVPLAIRAWQWLRRRGTSSVTITFGKTSTKLLPAKQVIDLLLRSKDISTVLGLGAKFPIGAEKRAPQSSSIKDKVHFTLTAPTPLPLAQPSELHFWIHTDSQRNRVLALAREINTPSDADMSIKSTGPYPIAPGSHISVRIKIDGLICRETYQRMVWTGEIGHSSFVVEVPADTSLGTHVGSASIRLNGCQIAKMSFVLNVGRERGESTEIPSTTEQHKSAFASYASQDRAEVVRCVQAMETAYKGLKVFVDIVELRSGEKWDERLHFEIANADIFYLFWCRHAAASAWVKKEWQLAGVVSPKQRN